jgi:uncharacterized OB-fold protein
MTAKPVPEPTELTQPYWDAAARGELALQRCRACGRWNHFPDVACPACGGGDLAFEPVSGRGTVETFSVVHRSFVPGFAEGGPYAVAWIALPEQAGLRVFANILDCPPERIAIGMPVEVCFEPREGFGPIPNFRPRSP